MPEGNLSACAMAGQCLRASLERETLLSHEKGIGLPESGKLA